MTIPFTDVSGSTSITTSEFSLPGNTTSGVPTSQTTYVDIAVVLDVSAMLAGDQFDLVIYEKVAAGTQGTLERFSMFGAQDKLQSFGPFRLHDGWDVTLKKIAGTNRTIKWSLREDVGDRNLSTWLSSTPNALSSGRVDASVGAIANDAVTAAALAADGITKIAAGVLAATVEGTITVGRALRGFGRLLVWGKKTGYDTNTVVVRDKADTKDSMTIVTSSTGWTSATMTDLD